MNERTEALEQVSAALPAFQQIDELFNTAQNIDQQNMMLQAKAQSTSTNRGKTMGIVAGVVTFMVLEIIMTAINSTGKISGEALLVFLIFAIIGSITVSIVTRRKLSAPERGVAETVSRNTVVIQRISAQIQEVAEANAEAINLMPRDYRYYDAVRFFEQALANGRADSMKEAINLYEEELHRRTLENYNQQMVFKNERQSQMLASIENNSRSAARGANIAATFSILSFLK